MRIWPTPKDALDAAITILVDAFGDYASVSEALPKRNYPDRFVKVTQAGGSQTHPATDNARILVECFAKDVPQAIAMCHTARAAFRNASATMVHAATGDIFVRWWGNEDGPTHFPHPDILDRERCQLHGTLAVKSN